MAEMLRGKLMFNSGDWVSIGGGEFGSVEHDLGGEVVHVHPQGSSSHYPHSAVAVPRGSVALAREVMDTDSVQIEIYSRGSTHTLYECCGFDDCRRKILHNGLGIPESEVFQRDQFFTQAEREPIRITVTEPNEPSSCIWCFGCGDFIQHGSDCECGDNGHNPEADREAVRPMVVETGLLELRPF